MQGLLRGEPLTASVETECAHCGQTLHLEIDSELGWRVGDEGAVPLVLIPLVDFDKLDDPSIIDAF